MSSPEIMMLLKLLPKALSEHPEWFSNDEKIVAERLLRELRGQK